MSILSPILSVSLLSLGPTISQSEDDAEQISTILRFYEVMTKPTQPTVADFYSLFGPNNEAELALVFNRKFPFRQWNKDPESIEYSRKMYEQPTQFTSMFLQCIRSEEPSLFSTTTSRLIQFPPEADEDFTRYTVVTGSVGITFVFSQNDPFIETVYLPSGKSIDTLTDTCKTE